MDIDENDLLYSNVFIPQPELNNEISNESNEEFKKFYKQEESFNKEKKLKDTLDRMSIRSLYLNEDTDSNSILNSNRFNADNASIKSLNKSKLSEALPSRRTKEIVTYVSVDSRDRDKLLYKTPSHFEIFLGKTFYNVKSIKLASVEFPNTNAVINSNNNKIYWRNLEDIKEDTINAITQTYPTYDVSLRIGSYISGSLQTEISNKLATIKRKDGNSDYHYFLVTLDVDTDIVTFTSLILSQLENNPIKTTINSTALRITAQNHGYENGEYIYLVGAKTLAGIPSTTINAKHKIALVDLNTFDIEINIKAGETLFGGGNTVKSGRIAPFQLLFGENSKTVAQNIGFPLENSSQLINTYIKSITNFYQAIITTKTPHLFQSNFDYIGKSCTFNGSGTVPTLDGGNKLITRIISSTSFAIQISNKLVATSYRTGQITFNGTTFDIESINNQTSSTILIETFTDHNYSLDDINTTITLYDTTTTPTIDGNHKIYQILDTKTFVIPGEIPSGGEILTSVKPGNSGSIPRNKPLTTKTVKITNAIPGPKLYLTCPNHELQIGDTFMIYNLITTPPISNTILTVLTVPSSDTIVIDKPINYIDTVNIDSEIAYIGTGLFSVSFPNHGFNNIVSIQNTTLPIGQTAGNLLILQTQLPHNFTDGELVRISKTDCDPPIDGSYDVSYINSDTFTIPYSFAIKESGTSGIIGFAQDFHLYGATDVGGILSSNINGFSYDVRDIIDENNFTFYKQNEPAHSTEKGGGNSLYISSLLHGFNGQQTNTKNNLLNRSINLEGENYSFLCCPQLSTMLNTGNVKDVFARITLDQSPGNMVFSYLSNPKTFDTVPLHRLENLEFSVLNYDGSFYEFNDLDYSFTLEITEVIDITDSFNISSKRGIVDN